MSYFKVLGLQKEPFSTSPDPSLFYLSQEHRTALYRLRISLKLKRGMSLILGDVGAGKTTLSRRLAQILHEDPKVHTQFILNPLFEDEKDFLREICVRFGIPLTTDNDKASTYFKEIENFLFRKGVAEARTVVLLIDEAQKLSDACLEALRGLLNYETNEYKILQLILVSQLEIVPRLSAMKNFWDRISLKSLLHPFNLEEMREMIAFRLRQSGYCSPVQLFTAEATQVIHRYTLGQPRRVTELCHDCLEYLVMYNKNYVDRELVESLIERESNLLIKPQTTEMQTNGIDSERANARRTAV